MIKHSLITQKSLNFLIFRCLFFILVLTFFFPKAYWSFAAGEEEPFPYYILSPGDVLEIKLWGYTDLTSTVAIQPDGMISLPLGGQIIAAGKTLEELREGIFKELEKTLPGLEESHISLTVVNFRPLSVSVLGEVRSPGLYHFSDKVDILKAISAAGGLTDKAGLEEVIIVRENQEIVPVDLKKLLEQNDLSQNYSLNSGDSLYIPKAFTLTNISVAGEVKLPGFYTIEGKADVLKAISAAGGLTTKANYKNSLINKKDGEVIPVDLEKLLIQNDLTQNYPLESGDSLFIPLSLENNIYVLGEVNKPGIYPLEGECTVIEAISQAGSYNKNARLKSCVVIRKFPRDEEGLKMRTITLKEVKVIREKYEQVIEIDLAKILKDGELDQNIALQPQDIVFLPTRPLSEFDIETILDCVTTGLTAYNVLLK